MPDKTNVSLPEPPVITLVASAAIDTVSLPVPPLYDWVVEFKVTMLLPVVLAPVNAVTPVPTKLALIPELPETVIAVRAELVAPRVNRPEPNTFSVRSAVSVMPANVVLADTDALMVANWLLLSVITPNVPPAKFSAKMVLVAVVVGPAVMLKVPPVPDKFKVVRALEAMVEAP